MHILKPEEILRIHDAVIEHFGGLDTQLVMPDEALSKTRALVDRIRTAMYYNTAYDWNNVFLCAAFQTHCIARAHAFADGNKRTALNAAGLLLKRAGYCLKDSEFLPELLVDLAQDRVKLKDIAARLKAEMTISDKSTDDREPNDRFDELEYMKVDPRTLQILRDFAEERTDNPTLCILGSSRYLSIDPSELAWISVEDTLLKRHPDWSLVTFDCNINANKFNNERREDVVNSALMIIEKADLLHLRCLWSLLLGWSEDVETVMQALDARAKAGKRTLITSEYSIVETFSEYNRPIPAFFADALIADFSLAEIER